MKDSRRDHSQRDLGRIVAYSFWRVDCPHLMVVCVREVGGEIFVAVVA